MPNPQLALLALIGLAATSSPAVAQVPETTAQEHEIIVVRGLPPSRDRLMRSVYIGDLDLKSAAGQQAMEKRVDQAVVEMCAIPTPIPSYGDEMTKPCRDEAWASARPQMSQAVQKAAGSQ
jgi:UrcA family protein